MPFSLTGALSAPPDKCPLWVATSTGRRNTSIKFLGRGSEPQRLAWPSVELSCHFIQMGLRVNRQVSPFGEVLPEQAVGVLVGAALPRALRIAEVDVDVGRQAKSPMIRKLLATVPGQGLVELRRQLPGLLDQRRYDCLRLLVG